MNNKSKKNYYIDNFLNTNLLPITPIISYINYNYKDFKEEINTNQNEFNFFFDVPNDFIKGNKVKINQLINKNKNMSVDKLLAYALYLKSGDFFSKTGNLDIELLKNQIGKDSTRINIFINYNHYKFVPKKGEIEYASNDEKADYFIIKIIEYLENLSEKIDYNLINKIGIICCQNLFNLIVDQLNITIMNALAPEMSAFMNGKKHIEITIIENAKLAKLFFSGNIVISYKENLDPEYTCGSIDFILTIDLLQNNYFFERFYLEYDSKLCNPNVNPEEKDQEQGNQEQGNQEQGNQEQGNQEQANKFNFDKYKNLIPVAAVTGAVIASPFLLGILGGKTKKKEKKRTLKKKKKNKI